MKKSALFLVVAAIFSGQSFAQEQQSMIGRWDCWHDDIEITDTRIYKADTFRADSFLMGDGRYVFKMIDGGGHSFSDADRVQYGGEIYAKLNGSSIFIDIPKSMFAETATAVLSVEVGGNYVVYKIDGSVMAETRRTISEEFVLGGRTHLIPKMIMQDIPVSFHCTRRVQWN